MSWPRHMWSVVSGLTMQSLVCAQWRVAHDKLREIQTSFFVPPTVGTA
jgi:hypothetical protein